MAQRASLAHHLFLYSWQAKDGFYIFKWLRKKSKEEKIFCEKKIYFVIR